MRLFENKETKLLFQLYMLHEHCHLVVCVWYNHCLVFSLSQFWLHFQILYLKKKKKRNKTYWKLLFIQLKLDSKQKLFFCTQTFFHIHFVCFVFRNGSLKRKTKKYNFFLPLSFLFLCMQCNMNSNLPNYRDDATLWFAQLDAYFVAHKVTPAQ